MKILNKIILLFNLKIFKAFSIKKFKNKILNNKVKYLTDNCFLIMKIDMKKVFLKINTGMILNNLYNIQLETIHHLKKIHAEIVLSFGQKYYFLHSNLIKKINKMIFVMLNIFHHINNLLVIHVTKFIPLNWTNI